MRDRFIAAIDLGSSAIRLAVGQVTVDSDRREILSMIGADEVLSVGISKGAVQSLDDVTSAVSAVLDRVERNIGIPVTEVYVGVGGAQVQVKPTKGVVGISNPDGIREEDYRRVLEHAAQSSHSANYEVLHRLPQRFTIDGQQSIKDPVGMQGARLEAEVCVIQGLVGHVRNITQSVMRTNVDVTGLVFSPLATAEAFLTPRQRDLGSALVNIGATTTSLAVFEDGELLHAVILPIGSDHVTRDIALGLQTSLEVAEQCKWHFVHGVSENMSNTEAIDLQ
ncbi:MAG: cell division protein FtsA, partial [Candidatus Magasanikbacteria bacterium]|nr:cell division protein FtsA [Candidatus Magasanikbacteria bacterium]